MGVSTPVSLAGVGVTAPAGLLVGVGGAITVSLPPKKE